ncbi:hypothetical protein MIND_00498300 [Mycena indigotica]|uniref:Uncharacterized protein n=1 Tax=Mycena indigotica TaxID=2126181 RepID=A0A8H6W6W1_9AGAR|nr:uncharacterized protein MIND_00498300 [Mycena indigotica]KAF7307052.1 hypothetical protein MIND_00498300 [Mycena indigotica]
MILPSPTDSRPPSELPNGYGSTLSSKTFNDSNADKKILYFDQKHPTMEDSSQFSPNLGSVSRMLVPPRYSRRPSSSIVYTFEPLPSNCMLLSPPPKVTESQKPYHITVSMNCFTPTSYITSVRKQSWDGEPVGDFELGATRSGSPGTICLRKNEYPIPDVLTELPSSRSSTHFKSWRWEVRGINRERPMILFWDDFHGGGVLTVYSTDDRNESNLLARFTPRTALRRQGQPVDPPNLLVTPLGHDWYDDILLSALIIERMRTTPTYQ